MMREKRGSCVVNTLGPDVLSGRQGADNGTLQYRVAAVAHSSGRPAHRCEVALTKSLKWMPKKARHWQRQAGRG